MATILRCETEDCEFNANGQCTKDEIVIDDSYTCETGEPA